MSDPNPSINESAVAEAIKALLIKGANVSKRENEAVDDNMNFTTLAVRSGDEIRTETSQYSRQLRVTVMLKEKLSIMNKATRGLNVARCRRLITNVWMNCHRKVH